MSTEVRISVRRITLSYGHLRVRVESPENHLAWLEEFLTPHFQVDRSADSQAAAYQVCLTEDDDLFAATLAGGGDAGDAQLECFALDSSVVRLPAWRSPSGATVLFDEKFQALYLVGADRHATTVLTRRHNSGARMALMRVVRELAMNHTQCTGGLVLHAAAAAVGGHGMIIAGKRAAGKTTLLVQLLRHPMARYLSNDRAVVTTSSPASSDTARLTVRGMPTLVTVRPRTLRLFPRLKPRLLESGYHPRLSLAEIASQPRGPVLPWGDQRFGLSPAQFCELLDVPVDASSPASVLLFPRITHEPGGARLLPLSATQAAARLADALFGVGSLRKTSDVFAVPDDPPAPDSATLHRLCNQLVTQLPCIECEVGLSAYDRDDLAAQILDQLTERSNASVARVER